MQEWYLIELANLCNVFDVTAMGTQRFNAQIRRLVGIVQMSIALKTARATYPPGVLCAREITKLGIEYALLKSKRQIA